MHSRTHTGGGHHFTSSLNPPKHFCGSFFFFVDFNYLAEVTRYSSHTSTRNGVEMKAGFFLPLLL